MQLPRENKFAELVKTDIKKHIEEKGKFKYVSWSVMTEYLRLNYPDFRLDVQCFDNLPYIKTEKGDCFVAVLLVDEVERIVWSEWLPVMDNKNNPISTPNAIQINSHRCASPTYGDDEACLDTRQIELFQWDAVALPLVR